MNEPFKADGTATLRVVLEVQTNTGWDIWGVNEADAISRLESAIGEAIEHGVWTLNDNQDFIERSEVKDWYFQKVDFDCKEVQ